MKPSILMFICVTSFLLAYTSHLASAEAQHPRPALEYGSRQDHPTRMRRHRRHLGYLDSKYRDFTSRRRQDPPSPDLAASQPSITSKSDGEIDRIAALSGKDKMMRRKRAASICNVKRSPKVVSHNQSEQPVSNSQTQAQLQEEKTIDKHNHQTNSTGKVEAGFSLSSVSHSSSSSSSSQKGGSSCFPALGFKMPGDVPSFLKNWWCEPSTEQAFVSENDKTYLTHCSTFGTVTHRT